MKTRRKCGKFDPFHAVGMIRDGEGKLKLRWTNDPDICLIQYRSKGYTDIQMIRLSEPLSKPDSVKYLKHRVVEFHGAEHMAVIDQYLDNPRNMAP